MVGEEGASSLGPEERDEVILREHLPTFRITTYSALHRLFFDTPNAARKWVSRRKADGYIASGPLTPRRRRSGDRECFYLTSKAVNALQLDTRLSKPPGPLGLAKAYAVLAFSCLGDDLYHKASAAEFGHRFPTLAHPNLQNDYYYRDHDFVGDGWEPKQRIGYIYPDTEIGVARIAERFGELVAQRRGIQEWRDKVISKDRFIIAIVTTAKGKKQRIEEALDAQPRTVPFRVAVIEDLRNLIPESTNHATGRGTNS